MSLNPVSSSIRLPLYGQALCLRLVGELVAASSFFFRSLGDVRSHGCSICQARWRPFFGG